MVRCSLWCKLVSNNTVPRPENSSPILAVGSLFAGSRLHVSSDVSDDFVSDSITSLPVRTRLRSHSVMGGRGGAGRGARTRSWARETHSGTGTVSCDSMTGRRPDCSAREVALDRIRKALDEAGAGQERRERRRRAGRDPEPWETWDSDEEAAEAAATAEAEEKAADKAAERDTNCVRVCCGMLMQVSARAQARFNGFSNVHSGQSLFISFSLSRSRPQSLSISIYLSIYLCIFISESERMRAAN